MNDITDTESNMTSKKIKLPEFKEIQKVTFGETYKFINKLVKGKSAEDFENIDELVCPAIPLSIFDDSLRLILIDSLHLEEEVKKTLLSQNEHQVNRILKCEWFFRNCLSAQYYIKEIFPRISVSLRWKIVAKLSKCLESEKEAEEIVEFLYKNFSCEQAEVLLPKCSRIFILNYLTEVKPVFLYNSSVRVLLNLSKRYPDIVGNILSKINCETHKFKKVYLYLAAHNPDIIVSLLEKKDSTLPIFGLGRKCSRKIGLKVKDSMFKSFDMSRRFHKNYLFSSLCWEDQVRFLVSTLTYCTLNVSYSNWQTCSSYVSKYLKFIPPGKRLHFVETAFKKLYDSDFKDHPECWSPSTLELIPMVQRQPFVLKLEELYEKGEVDDLYDFSSDSLEDIFYLYDFKIGFGKLKGLISKSPVSKKRLSIIHRMVKSCHINRDVSGLQELVEYMDVRHRNEEPQLIFSFIIEMFKLFPTSSLNLQIFEKLDALAYYSAIKQPSRDYEKLLEKHILFRLDNNMNVDSLLQKRVDFCTSLCGFSSFVNTFNSKHSRFLVLFNCKEILKWIEKAAEKDKQEIYLRELLDTVQEFNKLNRSNPITLSELPGVEKYIARVMRDKFGFLGVEDWPALKDYSKIIHTWKCDYFKVIGGVLREKPEVMSKHFDAIVKNFFESYYYIVRNDITFYLKICSFCGLTEEFKKMSLSQFKNGDVGLKKTALTVYSYAASLEEFSEAVVDYLPKNENIEETTSEFATIQLLVPKLIKNLRPRHKSLNFILKFFFGDFLRAVMPSLYICCHRTRTDEALPFLKKVFDEVPNRISYKKDLIRLIVDFSSRREKMDFCLDCWEKNKHYSIRKILLTFMSKTFLEQPTKEVFEVIKKLIVECDEIVIEGRPPIERVPEEVLSDYVSVLWDFSEKQDFGFRKRFQRNIIYHFKIKNIGLLSDEFCQRVIRGNLFKPKAIENIKEFTVFYLISDPEKVQSRMALLLEMIKGTDPKELANFMEALYNISHAEKGSFLYVFQTLLENCPFEWTFEERLSLTYNYLYQKIVEGSSSSFELGKLIRKEYEELKNVGDLTMIFAESLGRFFCSLGSAEKPFDELLAIKGLVEKPLNRSWAIIGISLLPKDVADVYHSRENYFDSSYIERKKKVNEIAEILKEYGDEVVDIYYKRKFEIRN